MWNDIAKTVSSWLPVIAFFLPLAVGLVLKTGANKAVKTAVQLVATLIATLVASSRVGGGILTGDMLKEWASTSVYTIAAYYGVWSNIEVSKPSAPGGTVNLGCLLPAKGIGPSGDVLTKSIDLPFDEAA